MRDSQKISQIEETKDRMQLSANADIDDGLRNALIGDDGILKPGAMPKLDGVSAPACKQLLDAVSKAITKLCFLQFLHVTYENGSSHQVFLFKRSDISDIPLCTSGESPIVLNGIPETSFLLLLLIAGGQS